jgi:hypothetical protein
VLAFKLLLAIDSNSDGRYMSSIKLPMLCAFCARPGKMTKGHIWPKWLQKVRPPTATSHTQVTGEFVTFTPKARRPPRNVAIRQGHAGSRKIKNVCRNCNNGWMSQIEQAAMEAAIPLILAQQYALTAYHQRELARWFALMTMMAEFMDPLTKALTSEHRKFLKENLDPPPIFKMWIGRYSGTNPDLHWSHHMGMNMSLTPEVSGDPYKCNTQTTTLVIGALCIHTYSSTVDPDFPGYRRAPIKQVWPVIEERMIWPPMIGLNDDNIIALAEALGAQTKPLPGWE